MFLEWEVLMLMEQGRQKGEHIYETSKTKLIYVLFLQETHRPRSAEN